MTTTKSINNNAAASQQIGQTPVDGARAAKARQAEKSADAAANEAAGSPAQSVGVDLSPSARHLAESHKKALEIARQTPDVREDRVAELRKRIQEGSYQVNAEGIADGILREAMLERLAETKD